jgi:5,10-methylenetetrahydrofolate reductase
MAALRNLRNTIATAVAGTPPHEVEIADLLNRRTDLSTFVVHLTMGDDPKAALMSILSDHRINAGSTPPSRPTPSEIRVSRPPGNPQASRG